MATVESGGGGESIPEEVIPPAPPAALLGAYLKVSWAYVYWCLGMLAWSLVCVGYFVMTKNPENILISLGLAVLGIAMIVLPTFLFGGETWHKRLGWITVIVFLFSLLFAYPSGAIVWGVARRVGQGRYNWPPYSTDVVHAVLGVLTVALHIWTALIAVRAVRLVRKLARGDWGDVQVAAAK